MINFIFHGTILLYKLRWKRSVRCSLKLEVAGLKFLEDASRVVNARDALQLLLVGSPIASDYILVR